MESTMRILLVWILNAVALWIVTLILPGVQVQDPMYAFIAAIVLGLVNALIKPVLVLLTLPVTIVTLGLFLLVINGLLFWAVGALLPGFHVAGFWWGVAGAILFSLFSWAFSALLPKHDRSARLP
jgi:putative membrane protein